jgi:hypothetical protein
MSREFCLPFSHFNSGHSYTTLIKRSVNRSRPTGHFVPVSGSGSMVLDFSIVTAREGLVLREQNFVAMCVEFRLRGVHYTVPNSFRTKYLYSKFKTFVVKLAERSQKTPFPKSVLCNLTP